MKSYNLEVIDIDTILHELFGVDPDSIDQIIDALPMANWTYGDTPYTLVDIDAFLEFLQDCMDHEICQALTQERVNYLRENIPVDVYVNLEGSK